ncbi:MAG TPA: NAD-dependent epimerase/dehydratase family protein [Pseudobdellovibrionaceae bacterium]|nr:NAD-dependent epimerase/dehydratase family protein [Pseudobdellovibrionaceae bacterium]
MQVLVLGGQKFLGKYFTDLLHKDGFFITLMQKTPFTENKLSGVEYLNVDILKKEDFNKINPNAKWDFVFDFSTQNPLGIKNIIEILGPRFKKYFYMSSMFIYPYGQSLHEEQFDPTHFTLPADYGVLNSVDALRGVEALIAQKLPKRFVIVRLPFVFGAQDPTLKLQKLIRKVVARESIYFPNLDARFSMVSIEDAGKTILKLCLDPFVGVVNVSSNATVRIGLLLKWIEHYSYVNVMVTTTASAESNTIFSLDKDLYFDTNLLKKLGTVIPNSSSYLEELIKQECQNLLDEAN